MFHQDFTDWLESMNQMFVEVLLRQGVWSLWFQSEAAGVEEAASPSGASSVPQEPVVISLLGGDCQTPSWSPQRAAARRSAAALRFIFFLLFTDLYCDYHTKNIWSKIADNIIDLTPH